MEGILGIIGAIVLIGSINRFNEWRRERKEEKEREATKPFISSGLLARKKELELALSTELEVSEEQEPNLIFTHGHYIEEPIEEETPEDCPF